MTKRKPIIRELAEAVAAKDETIQLARLFQLVEHALHRAESAERKLGQARKRLRELTSYKPKVYPKIERWVVRVDKELQDYLVAEYRRHPERSFLVTLHDSGAEFLGDHDVPLFDFIDDVAGPVCLRIHVPKRWRDLEALKAIAAEQRKRWTTP